MLKQIIILILFPQLIVFGTVDRIQKAMEKKEYERAHELIIKGYEKEPNNPGISYYQALLFFNRDYVNYSLDSSRLSITKSQSDFTNASEEVKADLREDGVTGEKINKLFEQIRDRSFQNTLKNLSVAKAQNFQNNFPNSIYDDILTYKVDSIEFNLASRVKNQKALIDFVEEHPTSIFKPKADSILDDMRVRELEKNGNLQAYYQFLDMYPFTRHRARLEQYVLKVSTASGQIDDLESFISFSNIPTLKKQAADVRYYLSGKKDYIFHPARDSLQIAIAAIPLELFPVVENQLIGFYEKSGKKAISSTYQNIPHAYKCELVSDDWIFAESDANGRIITKNGNIVIENVEDYRNIGDAVGLIKQKGKWWLYHKSGFSIISQPVQDAEVLSNQWIKFQQNDMWGLVSIMGLNIAKSIYSDIYQEGVFWIFEKDEKIAVYNTRLILKEVEENGLSLEFKFDDIELVNDNALIGFRDNRECLLDSTLNFRIPWGPYEIYPESSGWYLRSDQGYRLYNESEEDIMDQHYPYLESNAGWLAIQTENDWMLLPRKKGLLPSRDYDSLKVINEHAVLTIVDDKQELLFSNGENIPLDGHQISTFPANTNYLMLAKDESAGIYNHYGQEVISGEFTKITLLNDSLVKVQVRNKQGLIDTNGAWILNPVFDNIDEKDGLVLTLIDGKIGCYDPTINELIETEYEARVTRLGEYYLAKKNGKFGLVDFSKEEILSFNYDQIQQWNDSSYLVKNDQSYLIINSFEESLFPAIESMKLLVQNDEQEIYRFVRDGKYGLISNQFGELLKPEFTDIFNIGNNHNPVFFADQHLDKAGYHVVSYINDIGELILSRAYTKGEFELILCDD
ncbi:WG containing repeat-containing protein [Ekhidna lutea]|uniref:WG containing repeat-containing protein n=1 Tax=Ekhidna lutea TaxID=447679 RepID=A0A239IH79_EKHLU|nr:WG repeat-containing protein [Ekhidna lutea]SNS92879.1 WG containing repeat-containing protein [Ekhidna lutea]